MEANSGHPSQVRGTTMWATLGVWGVTTTLCLAPVRPHLEYRVRFRTSQFRGDAWKLTKVHETAIKMGQ